MRPGRTDELNGCTATAGGSKREDRGRGALLQAQVDLSTRLIESTWGGIPGQSSGFAPIGVVAYRADSEASDRNHWNVTHNQPALCGGMWGRTPLALDAAGK